VPADWGDIGAVDWGVMGTVEWGVMGTTDWEAAGTADKGATAWPWTLQQELQTVHLTVELLLTASTGCV
jgi:hypothetical protein